MIVCNIRNLAHHMTGVQRYTSELLSRFPESVETVGPARHLSGASGHAWEQFRLPPLLGGRLLWSPSNTGPLAVHRQVLSVMDMSPLDHPEWMSRRFARWYQFLLPRLIRRVALVLTISEFSRRRILHFCPEAADKVHVTHLAADARFAPASPEQVRAMRASLGLPEGRYIVALGSLEPRKNLTRALMAWEQILPALPNDVSLVLAGARGKPLVFAQQSFETCPPRVHLTGHVPDVLLPALYSGATAAVYLSLYEGFGLPPLEAMACGTASIVSDAGSLPEVVGDAAFKVDPTSTDDVARGILSVVDSPALQQDLAHRGLAQAARFDWARTASQTWSLLEQAARSSVSR